MKTINKIIATSVLLACAVMLPSKSFAINKLQLDIGGGSYDSSTSTIISNGDIFTLYAFLTPGNGASISTINALLADNYYISAALTPKLSVSGSLGSFVFGGTSVNVTGDMTYGNPPLETILALQGWDTGDLAHSGAYFDTYYYQKPFQFSSANQTTPYDTQTYRGGPSFSGSGMYYAAFNINTSGLADGYEIHFDLYSENLCTNSQGQCNQSGDVDVNKFAPFSHDAESHGNKVPEPSTVLLLGTGLVGLAAMRKKEVFSK